MSSPVFTTSASPFSSSSGGNVSSVSGSATTRSGQRERSDEVLSLRKIDRRLAADRRRRPGRRGSSARASRRHRGGTSPRRSRSGRSSSRRRARRACHRGRAAAPTRAARPRRATSRPPRPGLRGSTRAARRARLARVRRRGRRPFCPRRARPARRRARALQAGRVRLRRSRHRQPPARRRRDRSRSRPPRSFVQGATLVEERAELLLVARERSIASEHALPRCVDRGLDEKRERARLERGTRARRMPRAPPPSSTTAGSRGCEHVSAACSSSALNAASPSRSKRSATVRPLRRSTSSSTETKRRPSRAASCGPSVDFPAPMKPTSAT